MKKIMTMNRKVGENSTQKIIRLLKKLESELVEEGSGNYFDITFESEGNGRIMYFVGSEQTSYVILAFDSSEIALEFLEAKQLDRLLMIRESLT